MEHAYISKQAIMDAQQNTIGYELFFRDSDKNCFPEIDSDRATAQLIIQNVLLDDIQAFCLGKLAFINFHLDTLLNKYPSFFNKNTTIIEIEKSVKPSTKLLEIVKYYATSGYVLALNGYKFESHWDEYLPYISFVKIDLAQTLQNDFATLYKQLKDQKIKCLITKVETYSQFKKLGEQDIDFFQGYFFHKPEMTSKQSLSPLNMTLLNLMSETFRADLNFDNVAEIISVDINLTAGLLKLVNSAAMIAEVKISSIKQAAVFLGETKLKQFISIFALSNMGIDRPDELIIQSLVRAKAMEAIAKQTASKEQTKQAFIIGVLSSIDAILCIPLKIILKTMPLSEQIENALLYKQGELGGLLQLVEDYETGNKEAVKNYIACHNLSIVQINKVYGEASYWSYQMINPVKAVPPKKI